MRIQEHVINDTRIAELISNNTIIEKDEDALDLMGNLYYQGYEKIIVHQENITSDFFNLKNGMAGEILQKFSNYGVRLVIVGDFSKHPGKSLKDFIYESNKGKQINFLLTTEEALKALSE